MEPCRCCIEAIKSRDEHIYVGTMVHSVDDGQECEWCNEVDDLYECEVK